MLLAVKFKNTLKKLNNDKQPLEFHVKNIAINGKKVGCSGFVKNLYTGKTVYVNTDMDGAMSFGGVQKHLYRTARDIKDYRGGVNRWAKEDELAQQVLELLA